MVWSAEAIESLYHLTPSSSRTNSMQMLHAWQPLCHLYDIFAVHLTPYGADGSQIVLHCGCPGCGSVPSQHRGRSAAVVVVQHPVLTQISAQRRDALCG